MKRNIGKIFKIKTYLSLPFFTRPNNKKWWFYGAIKLSFFCILKEGVLLWVLNY